MSYSQEAYEKSDEILSAYRRNAAELLITRAAEIYEKFPEIKEIDDKITEGGVEMTRAAMKGDAEEIIAKKSSELSALSERKLKILRENGYSDDYMTDVYRCGICHDTGFSGGNLCGCRKKMMSKFDLAKSRGNGNSRFEDFSLDYYSGEVDGRLGVAPREHMKNILDYCRLYAENFSSASESLLMYGSVGLGKTFLCGCIASALAAKGFSVIFRSAYDIFESISKSKFNYKSENAEDVSAFYNCDLLILDDLGAEFQTEYTLTALFDILERRIVLGKPTVVNLNFSPKDIEKRYSDKILSRLLTFKPLMFLGNDIRASRLG